MITTWNLTPFCHSDTGARTLTRQVTPAGQLTIASCTAACQAAGFVLAGAEYSVECCTYFYRAFCFLLAQR